MKTLRKKNRDRCEDTNKPIGLQFPSISKGAKRTQWPRKTSALTSNTADSIFEQIYLITENDIKNAYFDICVILNTVIYQY